VTTLDTSKKRCPKCATWKTESEFSKSRSTKSGLRSLCKVCSATANKRVRDRNKNRENIVIPSTKTCFHCKKSKPGSDFYKSKVMKDGLQGRCKSCDLIKQRMVIYGTSEKWLTETFEEQNGKCAICGFIPDHTDKYLSVDHIHGTDRVRGLLCGRCNKGIGLLQDSPAVLRAAAAYIEKYNGPL
jgi:hypothetical protein